MRRRGVVLASAKGPVPDLASAVAGAPIKGGWWSHRKGRQVFNVLGAVAGSPDVLVCRLVGGKVTFVHRRLWPALVRAAGRFPSARLAQVREEHTPSGRHVARTVPFPAWVPDGARKSARRLSEPAALAALGAWAAPDNV